jgi:hypothetical protein
MGLEAGNSKARFLENVGRRKLRLVWNLLLKASDLLGQLGNLPFQGGNVATVMPRGPLDGLGVGPDLAAGKATGEQLWRMPLADAFDKMLNTDAADMKNIGGRLGGSSTAAHFIKRFIKDVPWAHLDIAGVAWQDGEQKPLIPSWGTGWGVKLLDRLVREHYEG